MNALSQIYSFRSCEPARAVRHFLTAMQHSADATFPAWREIVKTAVEDCRLGYDERRAVFESQPLADYYFAGVVGLEAGKISSHYPAAETRALLAEIADRVDAVAERPDRLVSSLVFDIVSRIELLQPVQYKQPHDQVVRLILERMGWPTLPETRVLMGNILLRHQLGEPLACGVPAWWFTFHAKFSLAPIEGLPAEASPPTPVALEDSPVQNAHPPRRHAARRLV